MFAGANGGEGPPAPAARVPSRLGASWSILAVLLAAVASFAGSAAYSHHVAARIDLDALSIANNAAPAIEHLTAARREMLGVELEAASALLRAQEGLRFDRTRFDQSIARLHHELSEYAKFPFYENESKLYARTDRAVREFETQLSTFLAAFAGPAPENARSILRTSLTPAGTRANTAIEELIIFNIAEQQRLGEEIPVLRSHAAHVEAALQGVCALLALFLMVLVLRAARRYDRLLADRQRATEERAAALALFSSKLETLLASSVAIANTIGTSADVKVVFQAIADRARVLIGADYCALGFETDPTRPFNPWVFSGISPAEAEAMGRGPPRPAGVLGAVITGGQTIRVADVTRHAAFSGLPQHHPAMGPFLGVPVMHDSRNVGNLYLARKANRPPFSEDDARVIELLGAYVGVAIDNARLYFQAQNATRAREDLLATVSHDLKNPLNVVRMATRVLKSGTADAADVIARIDRATERMIRLISDLLDAARIEAGLLQASTKREDVEVLIREAVEIFRLAVEEKAIKLVPRAPPQPLSVLCERSGVQRVFVNLIGNAVKFTPDGGTVSVAARELGGEVEFSVTDSGPGIPADLLPHIFDRYWQQKAADHRGSGLGLYIAKGIVEAHGGRIWAESVPGKGTTMRFTLPASQLGIPEAPAPPQA